MKRIKQPEYLKPENLKTVKGLISVIHLDNKERICVETDKQLLVLPTNRQLDILKNYQGQVVQVTRTEERIKAGKGKQDMIVYDLQVDE